MTGPSNLRFAFNPPVLPSLAIAGATARFPVGAIYAFTGTYGTGPNGGRRPEPAVFTKGSHTVIDSGATTPYPAATTMFEPEIELVVAIGTEARDLPDADAAKRAVFGYAVGLDMTRRDIQRAARNEGKPWDMAKTFDGASPIAAIHTAESVGHIERGAITLDVNGKRAQEGDLSQMAWTPLTLVAMLSRQIALRPGDLIFTGTPAGETQLHAGDRLDGHIAGLGQLLVTIG
jgi:fumarylpyruvate hydrolase